MEKLDEVINELNILGNMLWNQFGTDSYEIRCFLHDTKEKLIDVKENHYTNTLTK